LGNEKILFAGQAQRKGVTGNDGRAGVFFNQGFKGLHRRRTRRGGLVKRNSCRRGGKEKEGFVEKGEGILEPDQDLRQRGGTE